MKGWVSTILLLCACFGTGHQVARGQIVGTTSLLTIPVAEMPEEGTITASFGYVGNTYTEYFDGRFDYSTATVAVVFLPMLELGFRYTFPYDQAESSFGDRMIAARVKLLGERRVLPSVVVGVHDFASSVEATYFTSLYAVASKRIATQFPIALHLGYGSDVIDSNSYQFIGVFGGIGLGLPFGVELLAEYDGERFNGGVRWTLIDRFQLMAGLEGLDSFLGGASVKFVL